jgi:single-strand DNA-binding protein
MARGFNQHTVLGTMGRDPESRVLPDGKAVCNFSLAVNERWTDKSSGELKESTEWINCVAFGKAAEIITQYSGKGHPLFVQGRSKTRKWDDKNGVTRYSTELHVTDFQLLNKGQGGGGGEERAQSQAEAHDNSAPQRQPDFDDDIPF